ncbi:unnamed protein product [Polarella glacialis]|uniref:Phosphatidylinositol-specific phospholipase C X domain-containing protein n=1 Tax=Polarella glacialis TaxID=89957 RepID=A0A813HLA8_POLGL|nr:unnamed protein product [Polarella glacialis]
MAGISAMQVEQASQAGTRPFDRQLPDMSDWMAGLPDDLPLAAVSMPGTHNSASGLLAPGHLSAVVSATRCQSRDLAYQLRIGVRFLDLRVRARPDDVNSSSSSNSFRSDMSLATGERRGQLCHGRVSCKGSLEDALQLCGEFLRAHPGEVILMRVKDEASNRNSARCLDALVHDLAESAEHPLYLQGRLPASLKEVRGRIVLLRDWAGGQLGVQWAGEAMLVQDEFWQCSGKLKWQVVRRHLCMALPDPCLLQVHFTSATYLPRLVPLDIAQVVNPKLALHLRCSTRGGRLTGIIAMDFPSPELCELVLSRNWLSLDPCRPVRCGAVGSLPASCGQLSDVAAVADWLEDLQCELRASAVRADATMISKHAAACQEVPPAVQWLARVYCRLVLERSACELCAPTVDSGILDVGLHAQRKQKQWEQGQQEVLVSGLAETQVHLHQDAGKRTMTEDCGCVEDTIPKASSAKQRSMLRQNGGSRLLSRLSRTFGFGGANTNRASELIPNRAADITAAGAAALAVEATKACHDGLLLPPLASKDFLENLECELHASASRADAAELETTWLRAKPGETKKGEAKSPRDAANLESKAQHLRERQRWLAKVFVRLSVERGRRQAVQAVAEGDQAVAAACEPPAVLVAARELQLPQLQVAGQPLLAGFCGTCPEPTDSKALTGYEEMSEEDGLSLRIHAASVAAWQSRSKTSESEEEAEVDPKADDLVCANEPENTSRRKGEPEIRNVFSDDEIGIGFHLLPDCSATIVQTSAGEANAGFYVKRSGRTEATKVE